MLKTMSSGGCGHIARSAVVCVLWHLHGPEGHVDTVLNKDEKNKIK
jgi:hypothetical protein